MGHQRKTKGTATAIPTGLAFGGLISLIVTVAGAAATAHLLMNQRIGENGIGYASMIILFVASLLGAWGAFGCIKKQRLQICVMAAAVYYLLLLAITALFFGGQYQGMGVTAVVIVIGALTVALFPTGGSTKLKFKKSTYR